MAFPSVIVECAFNNTLGDSKSAATGWTDITKYVDSISGTLRGRSYELGNVETGSIQLGLDNSDGRFTPGSTLSPYYPYVKANRRLRVRGRNMQQLNLARGGGQEQSTNGFMLPESYVWDAVDGITPRVFGPVLTRHNPVTLGLPGNLVTEPYHVESALTTGAAAGTYRVLAWWLPVEMGVRLTHSAYVWRVSGTEPAGTTPSLRCVYYDEDGIEIVPTDPNSGRLTWSQPTPTVPTRRVISHLPPDTARYAVMFLQVVTTAATTSDVVYAVTGVQTELPVNLAPSISGYTDSRAWEMVGGGIVGQGGTGSSDAYVSVTWAADSTELRMRIPHLTPGDDYTFAVQAMKTGAGPDVLLTGDDGRSGTTLTAENAWTTLATTFTAKRSEQYVKFIPQGTVSGSQTLSIRLARCVSSDLGASPAVTATDTDETPWTRPLPIFEGWIERWPVTITASSSTISVTVDDRLKKLGELILPNTLRAQLTTDLPDLVLPLTDSPKDSQGLVSAFGNWADGTGQPFIEPATAKNGPGASALLFGGLTAPTGEDALKLVQAGQTQGYALPLETSAAVFKPKKGTTYEKRFFATWSQTYKGTNAQRTDQIGKDELFQGTIASDPNGNQRSLIGFNWAAVAAELKGASVLGISVTLYAMHWANTAGGTVFIGTHTLTAAPTTFPTTGISTRKWHSAKWAVSSWRTIQLGAATGTSFKTGGAKGIVIGPGDSDAACYGWLAGAAETTHRPYVTIKFKK